MAERLGEAVLDLTTDDSRLTSGLARARQVAADVGRKMQRAGAIATAALTAPISAFGVASFRAFGRQQDAIAGVEAALKSMGPVAGFTSEQLQDMASQLQAATTFGDEDILNKVTANLLTFGRVQGDVFSRAQALALDLSARLGQDLQSSAIMLGKALNDPITGLTAMTRVGVAFTEQQKEQIRAMTEAGDVAGAQAIILAELERQYGGQAEAAARTASGGLAQLNNAWGDFQERIGEVVAELLPPLVAMLNDLVKWLQSVDKDTLSWGVTIAGLTAVVGPILGALGLFVAGIAAIGAPVALAVAGIAGLAAGIAAFWPEIETAIGWVKQLYDGIKTWLVDKLGPIIDTVVGAVGRVTGAFADLYQAVVGGSFIPDLVTGVEAWMGRLGQSMPTSARAMTAAAGSAFDALGKVAQGVGQTIESAFGRMVDQLVEGSFNAIDAVKELGKALIRLVAQKGFELLINFASGGVGGGLFGSFLGGIGNLFGGFFAEGGPLQKGKWYIAGERGPEPIWGGGPGAFAAGYDQGGADEQIVIRLPDIRPEARYSGREVSRLFKELSNEARLRGLRLAVERGR